MGVPPEKRSMGIPDYSVYLFPDYTEDRDGITNVSQLGYTMLQYLPGKYNAKTGVE
ncbi:MAG: hypothetical protein ABIN89_22895 [Chitinophagaceae bacterium]